MATVSDSDVVTLAAERAQIEKSLLEIAKMRAETLKLVAEIQILPKATGYQGMLATAALLGAGAAIGKLFFP